MFQININYFHYLLSVGDTTHNIHNMMSQIEEAL